MKPLTATWPYGGFWTKAGWADALWQALRGPNCSTLKFHPSKQVQVPPNACLSESSFRPSRSQLALLAALKLLGPISYSTQWPEGDLETDLLYPATALFLLWPKQICSDVHSSRESGSQIWQHVSAALHRNLTCFADNSVSKTIKKQELLK